MTPARGPAARTLAVLVRSLLLVSWRGDARVACAVAASLRLARAGLRTATVAVWLLLTVLDGAAARARAAEPATDVADRLAVHLGAGASADPASPLLELGVSRFFGEHVELSLRQEGGFATGRDDRWHLATTLAADLHLLPDPKPAWSPFVGVAGGALYDDRRATGMVGPEAGVVVYLTDTIELAARYQFRWAADRVGGLGHDQHAALLSVAFVLDDGGRAAELARIEESARRAEEAATKAEEAVARLEASVERLERAVEQFAEWFKEQLRKQ